MGRRTEDDEARDLVADLNNRGFRICESVPNTDAHYLEGVDAKEWKPIKDRRAVSLITQLLLIVGSER